MGPEPPSPPAWPSTRFSRDQGQHQAFEEEKPASGHFARKQGRSQPHSRTELWPAARSRYQNRQTTGLSARRTRAPPQPPIADPLARSGIRPGPPMPAIPVHDQPAEAARAPDGRQRLAPRRIPLSENPRRSARTIDGQSMIGEASQKAMTADSWHPHRQNRSRSADHSAGTEGRQGPQPKRPRSRINQERRPGKGPRDQVARARAPPRPVMQMDRTR